jgi:excisionase family DNA binding protein
MTGRLAYSLSEAAQLSSLSIRSLRYLMATGKLGFVRIGRRVLIRHADLERLLRQGYCQATDRLDSDSPIRPKNRNAPEAHTPEALDGPQHGPGEPNERP